MRLPPGGPLPQPGSLQMRVPSGLPHAANRIGFTFVLAGSDGVQVLNQPHLFSEQFALFFFFLRTRFKLQLNGCLRKLLEDYK